MTLEKANQNAKEDRIAAERAERQRYQAKLAYRREQYMASLGEVVREEGRALKKKHGLENGSNSGIMNISLTNSHLYESPDQIRGSIRIDTAKRSLNSTQQGSRHDIR